MNNFCSSSSPILLLLVGVCTVAAQECANFKNICGPNIDTACVRDFFQNNAHCSVVQTVNERPYYEVNLPIYLPKFGITVVTTKIHLSQLDGVIEEFYFNTNTNNLVISVNYKGLHSYAPDAIFAIRQSEAEPKVYTEYVNATYNVVLTAVIPVYGSITKESLENGIYSAHFPNTDAMFEVGPKLAQSDDADVQNAFGSMFKDVPTALVESFRTKSSYFFLAYLQNYICDFDLSPVFQKYDLTVLNRYENENAYDEENFHMPCADSDDVTSCVQGFFADHGTCIVPTSVNDKPEPRGWFQIPLPTLNSTLHAFYGEWSHGSLRGDITKFYINKQTGNLVMSVEFKALTMFTPIIHLSTSHRGKENTVVSDYSTHIYPAILTAVIPINGGLTAETLLKSFMSSYLTQNAIFSVGPKYTESKDPEMITLVEVVYSNAMTIGLECLITEALPFFLAYLQKYICNFGIPL